MSTNLSRSFALVGGVASALSLSTAFAFDAAAVQKEVDAMNESLPAMVSPVLREEAIRFTGQSLNYTFTRVGSQDDRNLNVTARAYLLRQLCSDVDTRQMMRDGLTFTFTYVDEARTPTPGAVLTEQDCQAARR